MDAQLHRLWSVLGVHLLISGLGSKERSDQAACLENLDPKTGMLGLIHYYNGTKAIVACCLTAKRGLMHVFGVRFKTSIADAQYHVCISFREFVCTSFRNQVCVCLRSVVGSPSQILKSMFVYPSGISFV